MFALPFRQLLAAVRPGKLPGELPRRGILSRGERVETCRNLFVSGVLQSLLEDTLSKISRHQCVKLWPVATNPVQVEKNLTSGSSADKSL